MTIKHALDYGKVKLQNSLTESNLLDSELLLLHVLQKKYHSRSTLLAHTDDDIRDNEYSLYNEYLEKRKNGICTAYITGHKEFRYLDLFVNNNVLVPRPDTETLVEAAIGYIDSLDNISLLDLCTGSGAVAISIKQERPFVDVYASDISEAALDVLKINLQKYNMNDKVTVYQSDCFSNIENRFNIITANAPYISSGDIAKLQREVQNEPHVAFDGGEDGLEIIRRIINDASTHLHANGVLLLEAEPVQMDAIQKLLLSDGFSDIRFYKDLSNVNRVISARTST